MHVEEYVEVKDKNIENSEEFHEGLIIEEYPKIKINEDPSIHKDLEVKMVETIKEEIIEEVVNDLDEIKLDHCNVQASIILVGGTETKFIDFIGVEIWFDHWLLFGEYSQLHEDQGTRSSSCPVDDFQVWQKEKEDEVFKLFVLSA